jgi:hypothetical protein
MVNIHPRPTLCYIYHDDRKVVIERIFLEQTTPRGVPLIQELEVWSPNDFEKTFFWSVHILFIPTSG